MLDGLVWKSSREESINNRCGKPKRELVKERKSSERRGEIVLSEGIQRCR